MNHLSDHFFVSPAHASTTLTKAQLRDTLLATDGKILTHGRMWDIKNKHIGAGVYLVFLKENLS